MRNPAEKTFTFIKFTSIKNILMSIKRKSFFDVLLVFCKAYYQKQKKFCFHPIYCALKNHPRETVTAELCCLVLFVLLSKC